MQCSEAIVEQVGSECALEVLAMTQDVEASGGMWTFVSSLHRFLMLCYQVSRKLLFYNKKQLSKQTFLTSLKYAKTLQHLPIMFL